MNMKANKYKLSSSLKNSSDFNSQSESIHSSIRSIDGVNAVRIDSDANTVTVDYDAGKVSSSEIEQKLKEGNFI
ncbi:heavy-metal-associated domain-containing protein [Gottschalkia acidurici]|uniref:heavy-metal-associated domain-containing protein n=1 Tax=Clostridium acidurici TaxID=1556 RepID=UPI00031A1520|nr:cation transporter [Gottschalkia acidurici]